MLTPRPDGAPSPPPAGTMPLGKFTGRLLVVLVIAALAGALWQLADILVLLFGAILLAIGLCAAARLVARHTGIRRSLALSGVFLLGLCTMGAALWVFGSTVAAQMDNVIQAAPAGFKLFMDWLTSHPYGRQLLDQVRGANVVGPPVGRPRQSPQSAVRSRERLAMQSSPCSSRSIWRLSPSATVICACASCRPPIVQLSNFCST